MAAHLTAFALSRHIARVYRHPPNDPAIPRRMLHYPH